MPKKTGPDNRVIVISCEDDKGLCKPAVTAGIPIVSAEFILTGILKQELDTRTYPFGQNETIAVRLNNISVVLWKHCSSLDCGQTQLVSGIEWHQRQSTFQKEKKIKTSDCFFRLDSLPWIVAREFLGQRSNLIVCDWITFYHFVLELESASVSIRCQEFCDWKKRKERKIFYAFVSESKSTVNQMLKCWLLFCRQLSAFHP